MPGRYSLMMSAASVARRVGMRREQHTVRDALHRSGEWMDGYGYALLADEWRAREGQNSNMERPAS